MLWPERRDKDPQIGNRVPGPSYIQRTTAMSYLRVPAGYLPQELRWTLMDWGPWLRNWLPHVFNTEYDLEIGPIPAGTPVSMLSNIQLLAESPHLEDKVWHAKKLLTALLKVKKAFKRLPQNPTNEQATQAFLPVVPDLIAVSKCPDYIINKGHYFGTYLSDDDKRALIELLKTF
jgi:hypothetical protein